MNYYNEFDPYAAQWLRNLIAEGLVPKGDVDERSIVDVKGRDLEGYIQCHFFAGIGGWPYALELAGWSTDEPVWTGSCPCQPFSVAGQRMGEEDERHLWPDFRRLIEECKPSVVIGEQVASSDGRVWLSGVRADLEKLGYAVGTADLCAASLGAPHIRQRLWWVADAEHSERGSVNSSREDEGRDGLPQREKSTGGTGSGFSYGGMGDAESHRQPREQAARNRRAGTPHDGRLGDAIGPGSQGRCLDAGEHAHQWTPWASGELVPCLDGKARRVEPGICPLAHGVSQRVGALKAYGNAIVPQLAAEFIGAFMECRP